MKRICILLLAVSLLLTAALAESEIPGEDIYTAWGEMHYGYDKASGTYFYVTRIYQERKDGTRVYPSVYAPYFEMPSDATALSVSEAGGYLAVINAGIFVEDTVTPDGLVMQNGRTIHEGPTRTHPACLPLTIDADGNLGCAKYNASGAALAGRGIVSAVTGFIPLVAKGKAYPQRAWNTVDHYVKRAQRQIIGQFVNGDYAVVTCEGRKFRDSAGWTLKEAQDICLRLHLAFAYNLDGGTSTETVFDGKQINTVYANETGRCVPTFIVFSESMMSEAIYDVSAVCENGAFSGSAFALEGASYTAEVMPDEGYEVELAVCEMSGMNYTFADGWICIPDVTGDISVTAFCKEAPVPEGSADPTDPDGNTNK